MPKKGIFSASGAYRLCSGGSGATRLGYIYEIALDMVDCKKDITTKDMLHGMANEPIALDILIKLHGGEHNFDFNTGEQTFFKINDYIGATPDAYKSGEWVGDAKCPTSIYRFMTQNERVPKNYMYQIQTQIMSLNVDRGYLINYLTKPEIFGEDKWTEYLFPIEDRYYIHEIKKDNEICDEILNMAESNFHLIELAYSQLVSSLNIEDDEFFYSQLNGTRYRDLKECWWTNQRCVVRNNNNFYVKILQ